MNDEKSQDRTATGAEFVLIADTASAELPVPNVVIEGSAA